MLKRANEMKRNTAVKKSAFLPNLSIVACFESLWENFLVVSEEPVSLVSLTIFTLLFLIKNKVTAYSNKAATINAKQVYTHTNIWFGHFFAKFSGDDQRKSY